MAQVDLSGLELPFVTIYRSPEDFPGIYVARVWDGPKLRPTDTVIVRESVEALREDIVAAGFMVCFPRAEGDDPCIVETYIQ